MTPFRVTREQNLLLETAAEACGKTKQAFIEEAVFERVDEVLDRKARIARVKGEKAPAPSENSNMSPTIFAPPTGFTDAVNSIVRKPAEVATAATNEVTPAVQAPVVVQVGNSNSPQSNGPVGTNMIDHMADWIVAGKDFEQTHRLRQAVAMLAHKAATVEERNTLAARLDEAIAAKKAQPQPGLVEKGRMAFNSLMHFLSPE